MYQPKRHQPEHTDFELLVIGSGAGGEVAAYLNAQKGRRIAIVESHTIGGECPNFGCVPTKSLLQAAEVLTAVKEADKFGVNASASLDYPKLKAWKDLAVHRTGTYEGAIIYKREGIRYFHGEAYFLDPWTVSINGHHYTSERFLVATGTHSVIPPITGLKETGYITFAEAIDLTKLPKSLFVLGGGAIGCEFAQLFNSLGSQVHIAEFAERLVALEDPEIGDLLAEVFTAKGITVSTGARVVRVTKSKGHKIVSYEQDGKTHQVTVQEVLVATGKAPNTDLGLGNAGVVFDKAGIKVNKYLQTTSKHIYAAGDVVGPYRFTHTASYQSRVAARNLFASRAKRVATDYRAIPRCVFVDPEIACVGLTEQELKDKKVRYQSASIPISIIGRANTSDISVGFVKVIADKNGVLLSASIMSPRAGEMIHELALAIQHRLPAHAITETVHAYPTWSEAVRLACQKIKSR